MIMFVVQTAVIAALMVIIGYPLVMLVVRSFEKFEARYDKSPLPGKSVQLK